MQVSSEMVVAMRELPGRVLPGFYERPGNGCRWQEVVSLIA
jgi:hypothetical protein